jgi:hypothetical protein
MTQNPNTTKKTAGYYSPALRSLFFAERNAARWDSVSAFHYRDNARSRRLAHRRAMSRASIMRDEADALGLTIETFIADDKGSSCFSLWARVLRTTTNAYHAEHNAPTFAILETYHNDDEYDDA